MKSNSSVINVGLSSFGLSGRVFHAPFITNHSGFSLKKVLERTKNLSRRYYTEVEIVRDFNDLINDPEIDLIVVNTPDFTHYEFAQKALSAGKHVIIEKPLTHDLREGEKLVELGEKTNQIFSVFQNRRWDGDFQTVQKIIEHKMLGNIVEFESHFDRFRNYIKEGWKEQKETGSGVTHDLGSHTIDQALYLFGQPQAVSADIRKFRKNTPVDDYYNLRLVYDDVAVILKGGYHVRESLPRYIINGDQGAFVKYGLDTQEAALDNDQSPMETNFGHEPEETWGTLNTQINGMHFRGKIETLPGYYMGYYDNIYNAINGKEKVAVPARDGLNVIRLINAAFRSSENNSIVQFPGLKH